MLRWLRASRPTDVCAESSDTVSPQRGPARMTSLADIRNHAWGKQNDCRAARASAVYPSGCGAGIRSERPRRLGAAPEPSRYLARHVEHEFAFAPGAIAITVTDGAGSSSVALRFDGGRAAEPTAEAPLSGRVNYLRKRAASAWVTDVPTFERIRYANVYRGIDAVFYAAGP